MKHGLLMIVLAVGLAGTARAEPALDGQAIRLAQSQAIEIIAPRRVKTDQEMVDFTGRIESDLDVTLTVNGDPVTVASDGTFRVRRTVTPGTNRLHLVAEDAEGNRVEKRILVRRRAAAAGAIDFGTYYALVIGNNDYQYLNNLVSAVADAHAVARILQDRYDFAVEVLIDATRYDIVSAIARYRATLIESDNLLIYYAGHGYLDVDSDEGYWLPVDSEQKNPANWLSNGTITAQLKAIPAKHIMVVADSCYSGRLTRAAEVGVETSGNRDAWLVRMAQRQSRTALTSGGLEPVLDSGGGSNSVFTRAFVDALDANTGIMDGVTLFEAVKYPVVLNADQTPEYADIRQAGHNGGDFLFVPVGVSLSLTPQEASPSGTRTAIDPALELAFWQSVENSDNEADLQAYLTRFPTGTFTAIARNRIGKLKEAQTALLVEQPEPPKPLSKEEVENDQELYAVITEFYNRQRNIRYKSGYSSIIEMTEIQKIEVLEISGNTITARVKFDWRAVDYHNYFRTEIGIATFERLGTTYKVESFE